MERETTGIIQLAVASVLFGLLPIAVRFGENLGPYNLTVFRIVIAAVALYAFFTFSKFKLAPFKHEKKKLVLFGVVHGVVILGYFIGIQFLSIASAVLLLYSGAIWILIFSHFLLKEKLTLQIWTALFIGLAGVFLVLSPQQFFLKESLIGSIACLIAGLGFGLVYVLSKTFKEYDKASLVFWQNLIATPFVLPLLFIDPPRFTAAVYAY